MQIILLQEVYMYVWFLTEAWDYWIRKIMSSCVSSAISCNFFIFLLVGGDTNNYCGDLNCHLAGRVLIPAVWWALRWSLVYVTRKNKKTDQSNPNPMAFLFKIFAVSYCALWSFSTCVCVLDDALEVFWVQWQAGSKMRSAKACRNTSCWSSFGIPFSLL